MLGVLIDLLLGLYLSAGTLGAYRGVRAGSPKTLLSGRYSTADEVLTTIRIALMGRAARVRALFLRFGWPALMVIAWPSMANWRLRGVGNVQRMLAHGQLRPGVVDIAANMAIVSCVLLGARQMAGVTPMIALATYLLLGGLILKFALYAIGPADLPSRLRLGDLHPFAAFLAIVALDYLTTVVCLAAIVHPGPDGSVTIGALVGQAREVASFSHVTAVVKHGYTGPAELLASLVSVAFCAMLLNQVTKYKKFRRTTIDHVARASALAKLGRGRDARHELEKIPPADRAELSVAQVNVLVALAEKDFGDALDRVQRIVAVRADTVAGTRPRSREDHMQDLWSAALHLSWRWEDYCAFIGFGMATGCSDAYVASLTVNMFGEVSEQAWVRLLQQAQTLAPERYPVTIAITHLLAELAHGSNEAAAAFLDDRVSSERDTMLVQRYVRIIVARAMVTEPVRPATSDMLEREILAWIGDLEATDLTDLGLWQPPLIAQGQKLVMAACRDMPAETAVAVGDRLAALPMGGIEGWDELIAVLSRGERLIGGT